MRHVVFVYVVGFHAMVPAQTAPPDILRRGAYFIETRVYSPEENAEHLLLFKGLRVADVSDALDRVGLPNTGLVDPEILPLWKDLEQFTHRICGIALTVRYVPTQKKSSLRRDNPFQPGKAIGTMLIHRRPGCSSSGRAP